MINKEDITAFAERWLAGHSPETFVVDVKVSPANDIDIEMAAPGGVGIDLCVELSHAIEAEFDREKEDYSLQVGSAGITEPFKVRRQYEMNLGNEVEVLAGDGRKYRGTLDSVGDDSFTVIVAEKVKDEGAKKARIEDVEHTFRFDNVKYTKYLLQF